MFIFGHMGVGSKLVSPFTHGLAKRWVLLGTLIPDLIDKPLYYGLVLLTGHRQEELGLICSTRTFGHTAAALLVLAAAAVARRSRVLAALALGMATHLLLDNIGDRVLAHESGAVGSAGVALLWPLLGSFPPLPFATVGEHLETVTQPWILVGEAVGAAILVWDWWKSEHQSEILSDLREKRIWRRRLGRKRRGPGSESDRLN